MIIFIPAITVSADPQIMDVWSYAGNDIHEPGNSSWVPATSAQKSAIFSIDSNRWETRLTTGHDQFDYQMYRFYIAEPSTEIKNLSSTWIGYGENQIDYDTYLHIWNNHDFSWEQLDMKHLATDGILNGSITINPENYVDINGYVYLAAAAKHYNYAPPAPTGISVSPGYTDVTISWSPTIDPENDTVEYYAQIDGVANSSWITGTNWYFSGLSEDSYYTYRIKSRDTFASSESSITTGSFWTYTTLPPSSCPFIYIWNGTGYEYVTDMGGLGLGSARAITGTNYNLNYIIPDTEMIGGKYNIRIKENLAESDFFDYLKLIIADVPEGYSVYNTFQSKRADGWQWHIDSTSGIKYNAIENDLITFNNATTRTPITAYNKTGVNVADRLANIDNYPVEEEGQQKQEYTLDFGNIEHPEYAKLLIWSWTYFNTTKQNVPMTLYVINSTGTWEQVADLGVPTGDLRSYAYNISNIWKTSDKRIKLIPMYKPATMNIIDKIALDDSAPITIEKTVLNVTSAVLQHSKGVNEYKYPTTQDRFLVGNLIPDKKNYYQFGNYTKYGDVSSLLSVIDDKFIIVRHGDELLVSFEVAAKQSNNTNRVFILDSLVYYVMVGSSIGQIDNIDLLPFKNMSKYPYNISVENYPYDEEHDQYLREWNTRVCNDGSNGTCYDSTTGKQNITGLKNVAEKPLPRSLNTNYVELKSTFKPGYNVSGYVTDISSGLAINGALVRTKYSLSTTTDANGFYSFILINTTYSINASIIGYDTNSTQITVNGGDVTNSNISLVYHPYDVSGYIIDKSSGLPLKDVKVKAENTNFNMTTGSDGFYSFKLIDGEHSIIAIIPGYAINSTTITINGANITNANISLNNTVPEGRDAWDYAGYDLPVPYSNIWMQATTIEKNSILYNDLARWETKHTTNHDQFDFQMYRFKVSQPINEVNNITVKWIGHGENRVGYDTYLYIWNINNVSWDILDSRNLGTDGILNKSITINVKNYIDINGLIFLGAAAKHYDYVPSTPSWISLDGTYDGEPITCSWGPVIDLDGDLVQYFANINGYNSGWINETSFTSTAIYEWNTCSVKTRDNFTYTESSLISTDTYIDYLYSLNTNYVELELGFNKGYNISGYITDISNGLPISGVLVQTNTGFNMITNSSGYYNFTLLNSTYIINATLLGYDTNSTTITINGIDLANVNISLLYKLRDLSGYIKDSSSGLLLSGVLVMTNTSQNTTTNSNGLYNFKVFDGTYIINASIIGYDANAITVDVNGTTNNVNISLLYHPYNLSGYVRDASNGLPLGGAVVKVADTLLNMTTSADGYYRFSLIDGEHSIIATLSTYAINSTTVTISGADVTDANILLGSFQTQYRDAWNYAGNSIPVPYSASWISATLAQKSDISYNDPKMWETRLTTGHDQFDVQMYRFHISNVEITNLSSTWIGYGENQIGYDTYLYIWNHEDVSWEQLDRIHLTTDGNLNGSITVNPGNYVDLNGYVYLAAAAKHYNYAPPAPTGLSGSPGINDVIISWSPTIDPENDNVEYYVQIDGVANSGWINGTSWSYSGLSEGSYYIYTIKARDTFANSESSISTGSFWTGWTPPSSCPFIFIWNGTGYEYATDMGGLGLGSARAITGTNYNLNYIIPDTEMIGGKYSIRIKENLAESDFFDYLKLIIADVPEGYSVYNTFQSKRADGWQWHIDSTSGIKYNAIENDLITFNNATTRTPITAYNKTGFNVADRLTNIDNYPVEEAGQQKQEYTLDFGNIEHPEYAKLLIWSWTYFNTTRQNVPMTLYVINSTGTWEQVADLGVPTGDLRSYAYNISNIWKTSDMRIKLIPMYKPATMNIIDKIALDDSAPITIEKTVLNVSSAVLQHSEGVNEYKYPTTQDRFLVGNLIPDKKNYYQFGNYTKYGEVSSLLSVIDDKFVVARHGDELLVSFEDVAKQNNTTNRVFIVDSLVYYVMVGSSIGQINNIDLLPFKNMSKYPYNISVENYPYDEEHDQYLREWNTRVCNDGSNGTCYDPSTGKQIITGLKNIAGKPLPRSLNTNFVSLIVNNQLIGNSIFNLSSATTLSSSYITWNNDIFSDNRVYYGLNENDVNNLVNGSWSVWNNNSMGPAIRLTGLLANTTYYYRPLTWYLGTVNNSVEARILSTAKPGVWITPAESMVSPAGWTGSPANFRTINISAAPRDSNGRYIPDLSLEAVVYSNSGVEIGRINLMGSGPYYANFILPDYFSDERGYVTITNYSIAGEFSVLKWSCVNCHADGERYPSNFNSAGVHLKHTNTQTSGDCDSCHNMGHASSDYDMVGCYNDCHNFGEITCNECHNDVQNSADVPNTSVLSDKYGKDVHLNKKSCTQCHNELTSITPSPSCASTSCHPLTGSNLSTVPSSIKTMSHSNKQTVACGLCHNSAHDIKSLTMDAAQCKTCHTGITHNNGAQCTVCHGIDPHNISMTGGSDCLGCHNSSGVALHRIDGNAINMGIHADLNPKNQSDPNSKCWGCHDSNGSKPQNGMGDRYNTPYKCIDCHTSSGQKAGSYGAFIVDEHYPSGKDIKLLPGNDSLEACILCHNKTEMKVNYTSPDNLYTNYSVVSHYGKNRVDLHNINETNCSYCHQNSSEFNDMFQKISSTQITHNNGKSCLLCHRSTGSLDGRIHDISLLGGAGNDCISCHAPGDVNISKFARHANINTSDGPGNVTNNDCWTCHYRKDMNRSYVYLCDSCHLNNTGIVVVNDSALIVGNMQHGSNTCKNCHAPTTYHVSGSVGPLGLVENILRKMP